MNICKIKEVCQVNPPKKIPLSQDTDISFVPMSAVSTDGKVDLSEVITVEKVKSLSVFKDGDVIFAKITPCMENGKGAVVSNLKNGYGAGSTEFTVLRPNETHISEKWLYYYLSQKHFRWTCQQNMTGSAGQKRVPAKYLAECLIPVPPLEEQQRIVARIEELFSELDAAVATLERTKEQLAVYRQAVLKEAFEGLSNTTNVVLGDLILEKPRNGYSPKGVEYETPFRNLTLTSTTGGVFKEGYFKYVDLDIDNKSHLWVKHNDILIQRANTLEYVGTAVVYPGEDNRYVYPDLMMKCHLKEGINPYFIVHQLQSYKTRLYYQKNATGTAGSMPKINQKTVMQTPLIITDISTQVKIVSEIESRLSVCDKIEETVTTALHEAEAMRQSILKQAFAGEL